MNSACLNTDVLASLTPAQREAAEHLDGPLLILAGPGSGKTRVVTHRIANMLHRGISAAQILALTFTNKAADEMRERVQRLVGHRGVWMGTFHSFCARLLRRYGALAGLHENYSILDADDSRRLLKDVIAASPLALTHTTPESIAASISWAKNNLITAAEYTPRPGSATGAIVARIYPEHQRQLLASNAVDFDDLLLYVATLLKENPELRATLDERFRYVLVDEYQDTNTAQYAIVRALSIDYPNLAVTGDPDQSIYGWRGANLNNILDFERDFEHVKVVRLEQNFRSTPNILRVADHLITYNVRRKVKQLYTQNPEGLPVRLVVYPSGQEEADGMAARIAEDIRSGRRRARDIAVFYRINALSRSLEHALRAQGIPYQIVNGLEFYQRKEIKDVLAYLHLLNNPQNNLAFLRIINTPARGIGKKTIERLAQHAGRHRLSLVEAARESGLIESIPKRTAVQIAAFVAALDRMSVALGGPLYDLMKLVLDESGYRHWLEEAGSEEDLERLANIEEMLTAAEEFDRQHPEAENPLEIFLEQAALVADTDAFETESDKVTLMTLHAAKGLEFPVVYIAATEQGLLPHERSMEDEEKLEEERRLLFVGMTRARHELQLSLAQYRAFRGERRATIPSQFLMELPREEMQVSEPSSVYAEYGDSAVYEEPAYDDQGPTADVWSDDDFVQDSPEAYADRKSAEVRRAARRLKQASEELSRRVSRVFRSGMQVHHPEYGTGVILSISGSGSKRTARVRFAHEDEIRSFLLAHSPLEPLLDAD